MARIRPHRNPAASFAGVLPVFAMTMDHPFLYAVRDDQTGELLFVGVLEDPT